MKYKRVPGLDKDWSEITLGCWQLAPSHGWGDLCPAKDAETVIKTALDFGITAFDTAEGYGDGESERRLSKALGAARDEVIIVSKLWPDATLNERAYQERLEGSLRALKRDYVDVYLVHWAGDYFNTRETSARLCDCMTALKASGKARLVGLSNFHEHDLERLDARLAEFSINEIPYSLLEREYEGNTRALCEAQGVSYMAYSPTAKGLLARRLTPADLDFHARTKEPLYGRLYEESVNVFNVVASIAKERGCLPIHVALAWVLAQPNILTAIVGSRKPFQVPEFSEAAEILLTKDQLQRLTEASNTFHHLK
jgi:aryl-alcohol dehydrogenase-like predicted oxidoreductase